MSTIQDVERWRHVPSEDRSLEFKEAKQSYSRDKLYQYCTAIANEQGGKFVLGLTDTPPRRVVGSNAFPSVVAITEQLFSKLGFRVDVEELAHPDGRVVVFDIPRRPTGHAYALDGAYWMRSGSQLVAMSPERLKAIFAEGGADWTECTAKDRLSEEQVISLLDTDTFFDLLELPKPTTTRGLIDRLVAEGLVVETGGLFAVTRLAALLLAKNLADFGLDRKAPRVFVYNGRDKVSTKMSRVGKRGYAVGFQSLVQFVVSQLPQNEVIENALRVEHKLLPEVGIRELIANALIHQDLSLAGISPTVEIYEDRIEITNAGEPLVPVERFIDGYRTRNERLGDLMRRMRICEEHGSGIDRLVTLAETWQLPAPFFGTSVNRTQVIVRGPADFDDMSKQDRIRACYQHCVIKRMMNEHMTNPSLRERFGLDETKKATVTQVINATIEAGLIRADETVGRSRRHARYLPFWA